MSSIKTKGEYPLIVGMQLVVLSEPQSQLTKEPFEKTANDYSYIVSVSILASKSVVLNTHQQGQSIIGPSARETRRAGSS